MSLKKLLLFCSLAFFGTACSQASEEAKNEKALNSEVFSDLKLRNIGPAFMSGRIADIAIHPQDDSIWYVAVGSGGVWKTENSGTSWTPLFDGEKAYSIGSITIDKQNPHRIWVGTGENVGGRHVGIGHGIYLSEDGGKTWQNKGLKESEHLSTIIVHPNDSNTVWVAAQGPLWSKGGQRGLYKTTDGGRFWQKVLGDKEWLGVTDVVIDPRNPDRLYAATWQRHRTVAAYMGGGPKTGIHKSEDGGKSWEKMEQGLPTGNLGKIGLAISPMKPDVLYAAIELDRREGAVYRSMNRGASWTKQSDTVSGGTGPHYYQELYASPHAFDRIYLASVRMQVSDDGGLTFRTMKEDYKHSDNHALVFRADDPDYLLVGTDGGLYESFDLAKNWRYIDNLPITQFYKVAVDDAKPFYNVYGGTQDNNTQGGPARTDDMRGIANSDWFVTLGGDGHQPATEPGNPNIMYSQWQQGNLNRIDRLTGETVYIKPQAAPGDPIERYNWDAPILVSPHSPSTLYFASQRVWKSENRGDSWQPISGDLTLNQNRLELPIMGQTWGWDAPWDLFAMSVYNTITSLSESPIKAGLIYAGTDDGIIQVTEDGGKNWRKIAVSALPGVPEGAFVNDIKADLFNESTVYVSLDNHKFGDFKPYLYKSSDKGKTWQSMVGDLPQDHLVWRLVQDHKKENLFFLATEYGLFFSVDAGEHWVELNGGVPTISFRDLVIHKDADDLVGASFGRGMFVFDDLKVFRNVSESRLKEDKAILFPTRKAWWYVERNDLGTRPGSGKAYQGEDYYSAANPPFGAVLTYYLQEDLMDRKTARIKREKAAKAKEQAMTFAPWNELDKEFTDMKPAIVITIKDKEGSVIRRLEGATAKGMHRVTWDLRYPNLRVITGVQYNPGYFGGVRGAMVPPGEYTATLSQIVDGKATQLAEPVPIVVERLREGALPGAKPEAVSEFWQKISLTEKMLSATSENLKLLGQRINHFDEALQRSQAGPGQLDQQLHALKQKHHELSLRLNGSKAKGQIGVRQQPTISDRFFFAAFGTSNSSYGPTESHREALNLVTTQLQDFNVALKQFEDEDMKAMAEGLRAAGAPSVLGSL